MKVLVVTHIWEDNSHWQEVSDQRRYTNIEFLGDNEDGSTTYTGNYDGEQYILKCVELEDNNLPFG